MRNESRNKLSSNYMNEYLPESIENKNKLFIQKTSTKSILEKIKTTKMCSNDIMYEKMNKLDQMKALNEENHHLKEMLFLEMKEKNLNNNHYEWDNFEIEHLRAFNSNMSADSSSEISDSKISDSKGCNQKYQLNPYLNSKSNLSHNNKDNINNKENNPQFLKYEKEYSSKNLNKYSNSSSLTKNVKGKKASTHTILENKENLIQGHSSFEFSNKSSDLDIDENGIDKNLKKLKSKNSKFMFNYSKNSDTNRNKNINNDDKYESNFVKKSDFIINVKNNSDEKINYYVNNVIKDNKFTNKIFKNEKKKKTNYLNETNIKKKISDGLLKSKTDNNNKTEKRCFSNNRLGGIFKNKEDKSLFKTITPSNKISKNKNKFKLTDIHLNPKANEALIDFDDSKNNLLDSFNEKSQSGLSQIYVNCKMLTNSNTNNNLALKNKNNNSNDKSNINFLNLNKDEKTMNFETTIYANNSNSMKLSIEKPPKSYLFYDTVFTKEPLAFARSLSNIETSQINCKKLLENKKSPKLKKLYTSSKNKFTKNNNTKTNIKINNNDKIKRINQITNDLQIYPKNELAIYKQQPSILQLQTTNKSLHVSAEIKSAISINFSPRKLQKNIKVYDSLSEDDLTVQKSQCFSINPFSLIKVILDFTNLFAFLYIALVTPVKLISIPQFNPFAFAIEFLIDFAMLLDLLLGFFTGFYDFEENYIDNFYDCFFNYLNGKFFLDLICAVPFTSLFNYIDFFVFEKIKSLKISEAKFDTHFLGIRTQFTMDNVYSFNSEAKFLYENTLLGKKIIRILVILKVFKAVKILETNKFLNYAKEKLKLERVCNTKFFKFFAYYIYFLIISHILSCIFIFLGTLAFPNWITNAHLNDSNFALVYVASLYFNHTTIFTVGYGDIITKNFYEKSYNIVLMIVGLMLYSFALSSISELIQQNNESWKRYVKKKEYLNHLNSKHYFKKKLYDKINKHLICEMHEDKTNKNDLLNDLPISLRNDIIMNMNKEIINAFNFFKNSVDNDFIIQAVMVLKPTKSSCPDVLVKQGDFIEEIIFVKKGFLDLEVDLGLLRSEKLNAAAAQNGLMVINGKKIEKSKSNKINNFKNKNYASDDENENSIIDEEFVNTNKNNDYNDNNYFNYNFSELEKIENKEAISNSEKRRRLALPEPNDEVDFKTSKASKNMQTKSFKQNRTFKLEKKQESLLPSKFKILSLRQNEHYGDALMIENKRSPITLKTKSKFAEIFLMAKMDLMRLIEKYTDILEAIYEKSSFNMKQIKAFIKNIKQNQKNSGSKIANNNKNGSCLNGNINSWKFKNQYNFKNGIVKKNALKAQKLHNQLDKRQVTSKEGLCHENLVDDEIREKGLCVIENNSVSEKITNDCCINKNNINNEIDLNNNNNENSNYIKNGFLKKKKNDKESLDAIKNINDFDCAKSVAKQQQLNYNLENMNAKKHFNEKEEEEENASKGKNKENDSCDNYLAHANSSEFEKLSEMTNNTLALKNKNFDYFCISNQSFQSKKNLENLKKGELFSSLNVNSDKNINLIQQHKPIAEQEFKIKYFDEENTHCNKSLNINEKCSNLISNNNPNDLTNNSIPSEISERENKIKNKFPVDNFKEIKIVQSFFENNHFKKNFNNGLKHMHSINSMYYECEDFQENEEKTKKQNSIIKEQEEQDQNPTTNNNYNKALISDININDTFLKNKFDFSANEKVNNKHLNKISSNCKGFVCERCKNYLDAIAHEIDKKYIFNDFSKLVRYNAKNFRIEKAFEISISGYSTMNSENEMRNKNAFKIYLSKQETRKNKFKGNKVEKKNRTENNDKNNNINYNSKKELNLKEQIAKLNNNTKDLKKIKTISKQNKNENYNKINSKQNKTSENKKNKKVGQKSSSLENNQNLKFNHNKQKDLSEYSDFDYSLKKDDFSTNSILHKILLGENGDSNSKNIMLPENPTKSQKSNKLEKCAKETDYSAAFNKSSKINLNLEKNFASEPDLNSYSADKNFKKLISLKSDENSITNINFSNKSIKNEKISLLQKNNILKKKSFNNSTSLKIKKNPSSKAFRKSVSKIKKSLSIFRSNNINSLNNKNNNDNINNNDNETSEFSSLTHNIPMLVDNCLNLNELKPQGLFNVPLFDKLKTTILMKKVKPFNTQSLKNSKNNFLFRNLINFENLDDDKVLNDFQSFKKQQKTNSFTNSSIDSICVNKNKFVDKEINLEANEKKISENESERGSSCIKRKEKFNKDINNKKNKKSNNSYNKNINFISNSNNNEKIFLKNNTNEEEKAKLQTENKNITNLNQSEGYDKKSYENKKACLQAAAQGYLNKTKKKKIQRSGFRENINKNLLFAPLENVNNLLNKSEKETGGIKNKSFDMKMNLVNSFKNSRNEDFKKGNFINVDNNSNNNNNKKRNKVFKRFQESFNFNKFEINFGQNNNIKKSSCKMQGIIDRLDRIIEIIKI